MTTVVSVHALNRSLICYFAWNDSLAIRRRKQWNVEQSKKRTRTTLRFLFLAMTLQTQDGQQFCARHATTILSNQSTAASSSIYVKLGQVLHVTASSVPSLLIKIHALQAVRIPQQSDLAKSELASPTRLQRSRVHTALVPWDLERDTVATDQF